MVFLHFLSEPALVRPHIPAPLELELYQGSACLSLAAVTMQRFRPCRRWSAGWLFRPIAQQQFLNLRTYVRSREEPGVLFLWGWLSQPFGIRLPSRLLGLPFSFASLSFEHGDEAGEICGRVEAGGAGGCFEYSANIKPGAEFGPCPRGSVAEFAMERCTGFFRHRDRVRVFRAWHPPWVQTPIAATLKDASLVTKKFPWFEHAAPAGGSLTLGFDRVELGAARLLPGVAGSAGARRSVLSAFYEMP